jgi:hypothetical protein
LPYNVDNDDGFINEDYDDGSTEVKAHRMNISNAMWESYLNYLENGGTDDSDDNISE